MRSLAIRSDHDASARTTITPAIALASKITGTVKSTWMKATGSSERVMRDRLLCKLALAILLSCFGARARAAEPIRYQVRARVTGARVEGRVEIDVRARAGERELRLWLLPDRLALAPAAMNDRSARWIYPEELSTGGIEVTEARVSGRVVATRVELAAARDAAGADLIVPIGEGAEREVHVAIQFVLTLPGRFGRIGIVGSQVSLLGPWYPLLLDEGRVPWEDVPHRVEIEARGQVLVHGVRGSRFEGRAPYVPVSIAPRYFEQARQIDGVRVELYSAERLYQAPDPSVRGEQGLVDLASIDVVGLGAEVAEDVLATARALGIAMPPRLCIVRVPSRTELATAAPGVVLISDRLFQIFPLDQIRDYHRRALRRALFRHLAATLGARDAPVDRGWTTDLRATALVGLDEARRRHGVQSPQELLGLFAFHPAVDQLLYAPQVAFENAYFAAIEEPDRFADDPVFARAPLARGRRLLESARDALDDERFRRFVDGLVGAEHGVRALLREVAPERADRLEQWLRSPGSRVNYRLGTIRSTRTQEGWRHVIEVHRDGDERVEPVVVEAHDDRGHRVRAVWQGAGARGEVTIETAGALTGAIIDPQRRLPQSAEVADGHARGDDATDLSWRPPILNAFLFDVFVTEGVFTGLVDFVLRRQYDLDHTIGFRAERTASQTGGSIRYAHGLGPKVHDNRRVGSIAVGLGLERLHEGFADRVLGGWRTQLFLSSSLTDVFFSLDPRRGYWLQGSLVGGLTVRDDGSVGGTFRGGVRGGFVVPLGLQNALAFVGGGAFTAGDALASELARVGGGDYLRGLEAGELLGRGSLFGVVEHRLTFMRDLAWNLAHLVWLREIQLAVFAGGGVVFDALDGQEVGGAISVGGGLRFHYEYGGVQPGVIAVDIGIPISRTDDRVYTQIDGWPVLVRRRAPVGFYVAFDQYF